MRRGAPLQSRSSLARTSRLAPVSPKRRTQNQRDHTRAVRDEVYARDGWACIAGHLPTHRCMGGLSPHHLRKSGQGGKYTLGNLVTLCASMNTWVEDEPNLAYELGLVVRRGETEEDAWIKMRAAGLVTYGPDGGPGRPPKRVGP